MFGLFKSPNRHEEQARCLYASVVAQARQPDFYLEGGVPDTPDGRFDLILLHAFLVLHRLKDDHHETADLGQAVFDLMFVDMDQSLREMGIGDVGVSMRIKGMAKAFYGRVAAYEAGLQADDDAEMQAALQRNLYRKATPSPGQLASLAAYLVRESAAISALPIEGIRAGEIKFGPPPEFGSAE